MSFTCTFFNTLAAFLVQGGVEVAFAITTCVFLFVYWDVDIDQVNKNNTFVVPVRNVYVALLGFSISFFYFIELFQVIDIINATNDTNSLDEFYVNIDKSITTITGLDNLDGFLDEFFDDPADDADDQDATIDEELISILIVASSQLCSNNPKPQNYLINEKL
jgi:hypothetical protein